MLAHSGLPRCPVSPGTKQPAAGAMQQAVARAQETRFRVGSVSGLSPSRHPPCAEGRALLPLRER